MHPILVPKLNNNDDACVLLEWLCSDGAEVAEGAALAVLETSKATVELTAEGPGFVLHKAKAQETFAFGSTIGYVFPDAAALERHRAAAAAPRADTAAPLTITNSAKSLIAERSITDEELRSLGKAVIRRADVEALLKDVVAVPTPLPGLDRRQAAIARVVSQSHATIPRAFLLVRVDCEQALATATTFRARDNVFVGLPELVIQAVAALAPKFPKLYAVDGVAPTDPDIGVTFDMGRGLFIPVLRRVGSRSVREIAITLAELKMKAARDQFVAEDLQGGHISISLNMAPDVVLSLPIVLPGQICMVSVGGLVSEVRLGEGGKPEERRVCHIGIAYDHRFVNGFDAMQFAGAIKNKLEKAAA